MQLAEQWQPETEAVKIGELLETIHGNLDTDSVTMMMIILNIDILINHTLLICPEIYFHG